MRPGRGGGGDTEVDHGSSSFAIPGRGNKRIYCSPLANVALIHVSGRRNLHSCVYLETSSPDHVLVADQTLARGPLLALSVFSFQDVRETTSEPTVNKKGKDSNGQSFLGAISEIV